MVAPKINMHGKIYDLYDEIDRSQVDAKAELVKIHTTGKRAFLNPRKRKNQETTYYIYTADPTPRKAPEPKKAPVEEVKTVEPPKKVAPKKVAPKKNGKKANGKSKKK